MDPFIIDTTHTHACKLLFDAVDMLLAVVLRELDEKE